MQKSCSATLLPCHAPHVVDALKTTRVASGILATRGANSWRVHTVAPPPARSTLNSRPQAAPFTAGRYVERVAPRRAAPGASAPARSSVIAHRLTTVQGCDRLFFLKDGRLDATGTYDELLEARGAFQTMAVA